MIMTKLSPEQANEIADSLIEEARADSDRKRERRDARSAGAARLRATLLPVVAAAGTAAAATNLLSGGGTVQAAFIGAAVGLLVTWFARPRS